jgi:hypothetical protein
MTDTSFAVNGSAGHDASVAAGDGGPAAWLTAGPPRARLTELKDERAGLRKQLGQLEKGRESLEHLFAWPRSNPNAGCSTTTMLRTFPNGSRVVAMVCSRNLTLPGQKT